MLITRDWWKEQDYFRGSKALTELFENNNEVPFDEFLKLPVSIEDKIWVMTRLLEKEQQIKFIDLCLRTASKYADYSAHAAHYAKKAAETAATIIIFAYSVASTVALAAACAAREAGDYDTERQRQFDWLKGALS